MAKLDTSKIQKSSVTTDESKTEKFKKAVKNAKDFTIENLGKRGILIVLVIIGIVVLAVAMLLLALNQLTYQDLNQMQNLGLITPTEYNYRLFELNKTITINTLIGQVGAIFTAVCLIIAAVSPISGKGTPYFSEYIRLGLLAFAALMIYVAVLI